MSTTLKHSLALRTSPALEICTVLEPILALKTPLFTGDSIIVANLSSQATVTKTLVKPPLFLDTHSFREPPSTLSAPPLLETPSLLKVPLFWEPLPSLQQKPTFALDNPGLLHQNETSMRVPTESLLPPGGGTNEAYRALEALTFGFSNH